MNYLIKIENPEQSKAVQEALFKAGFDWYVNGRRVQYTDMGDLCTDEGMIYHSPAESSLANNTRITPAEVIANPYALDGATVKRPTAEKPQKEQPATVTQLTKEVADRLLEIDKVIADHIAQNKELRAEKKQLTQINRTIKKVTK